MAKEKKENKRTFSYDFSVDYNSEDEKQIALLFGLTKHIEVYLKEIDKVSKLGFKQGQLFIVFPKNYPRGKGIKPEFINIEEE